jgi:3-hydroxyphenylacetate 6-hydroxylase
VGAIIKFRSIGGNLLDLVPLVRLSPFSAGFRKARVMRGRRDRYLGCLNRGLVDLMEKGKHRPCIQANVISDKESRLNEEALLSLTLTILLGGLDNVTTLVAWSIALLVS